MITPLSWGIDLCSNLGMVIGLIFQLTAYMDSLGRNYQSSIEPIHYDYSSRFYSSNQGIKNPPWGLTVDHETVTLTVTSNGCTSADSFKIDVAESLPPQVKVIRVIPDNCRGVSRPIDLKFPLKAFGGRKFR